MKEDYEPDYLWDGSGPPDPDVVRLERVLGALAADPATYTDRRHMPTFPPRAPRVVRTTSRRFVVAAGLAAAVVCAAGVWIARQAVSAGWDVERVEGGPAVDGDVIAGAGRLHVGDWLVTDAASKARMEVADVGEVEVEPNTRLRLLRARSGEHRLSLAQGTIHARIWASPGQFYVSTPSSVAVDLGCAYTLHVDPNGAGLVRVELGWVGFESHGREAFIPEGAVCATRPGVGPGTPRYEDAPAGFAQALDVLDFSPGDDPRRGASLDLVLERSRRRDALTLWHLLTRGSRDERARVYDRMAALAPPPAGATRDAVLAGDRAAIDAWWNTLGLEDTTWWRLLKRPW
jgi:hypothetical protein